MLAGGPLLPQTASNSAADELFERTVRPVLTKKCATCHTDSQLGGLRVDSRENLLKGGKSGPSIIPGKPEESSLIRVVASNDDRVRMPLGGERLSSEEIADLTAWVRSGAPWPKSEAAAA